MAVGRVESVVDDEEGYCQSQLHHVDVVVELHVVVVIIAFALVHDEYVHLCTFSLALCLEVESVLES